MEIPSCTEYCTRPITGKVESKSILPFQVFFPSDSDEDPKRDVSTKNPNYIILGLALSPDQIELPFSFLFIEVATYLTSVSTGFAVR
jgi:hypothetical protein